MRTKFLAFLAVLIFTGAGCLPRTTTPTISTFNFDASTQVTVGQSVEFQDGLRATLTQINDSRCAKDVVCIWAGELSPVFQFSGGDLTASSEVILGTETRPTATVGPYTVTLVAVTETTATISVTKK